MVGLECTVCEAGLLFCSVALALRGWCLPSYCWRNPPVGWGSSLSPFESAGSWVCKAPVLRGLSCLCRKQQLYSQGCTLSLDALIPDLVQGPGREWRAGIFARLWVGGLWLWGQATVEIQRSVGVQMQPWLAGRRGSQGTARGGPLTMTAAAPPGSCPSPVSLHS